MSAPIAGPSLPAHLQAKLASPPLEEKEDQSDSDDDFMPALPPGFQAPKPAVAPIGPSLPPGFVISKDSPPLSVLDDDDEDDIAGPAPIPAHLASLAAHENEGVIALKEREERLKELERIEKESKVLKREEWMLLPPKELNLQSTIDPTKIKARGFKQTSKPHSSSTDRPSSSSLWTETPAERAQRLADEAIGKRRRAEEITKHDDDDDLEAVKKRKRDQSMRQQVEQHNKSSRNASLLDLHNTASNNILKSKSKAERELEKKQAVVWDHDSMMGVNSKLMSDSQKSSLIKDAKGLGGRFGSGSFL